MGSINSVNNVDPDDSYLISGLTNADLDDVDDVDDDDDSGTPASIEKLIERLTAKIAELQEKLAQVQQKEGEIQARIDSLNAGIAQLKENVLALHGIDLRDAQKQIIADTTRVNKLQRKLNGLDEMEDHFTVKLDLLVTKLNGIDGGTGSTGVGGGLSH